MRSRRVSFSSEADSDAEAFLRKETGATLVTMSPEPSSAGTKKGGHQGSNQPAVSICSRTEPATSPKRHRLSSTDSFGDASSIATDIDIRLPLDFSDGSDYCDSGDDDETSGCEGATSDVDQQCSKRHKRHHHGHHHSRDHHGRKDAEQVVADGSPPVPPDGGWGWAVVFASFMIHIVTDGVTYTFGNFFPEFLKEFKNNRSNTSWIISIMAGVTFGSGPLVSALSNKYDCQKVSIAGAVLASACLLASSFAVNISTLYVTIGLGTGLGLGFIYLPAIVMVTTYFEKKRAFATGIAVCGSGMGTLIFAPLTEYLIGVHGWRWALCIVGVLVLSCTLFAAMFRPLEHECNKENELGQIDNVVGEHEEEAKAREFKVVPPAEALPEVVISDMSTAVDESKDHERKISAESNNSQDSAYQSSVSSNDAGQDMDGSMEDNYNGAAVGKNAPETNGHTEPTVNSEALHFTWQKNPRLKHLGLAGITDAELAKSLPTLEQSTPVPVRKEHRPSSNRSSVIYARRRASSEAHHHHHDCLVLHDPAPGGSCLLKPTVPNSHERSSSSIVTRKNLGFGLEATGMLASIAHLDRCHHPKTPDPRSSTQGIKRRVRQGSLCHSHQASPVRYSTSRMVKSAEPPASDIMDRPRSSSPVRSEKRATSKIAHDAKRGGLRMSIRRAVHKVRCCPKDVRSMLSGMMSLAVLKDPVFLLYIVSNFITSIGYIVPYCFLVDRADLELNIDPQVASNILGAIGFASMAGRLIFGFAADRLCFNRLWLYIGCVATFGLATFLCPWATDQYSLTAYAVVFGATSGAYVGLGSVILVDLMSTGTGVGMDDHLVNAFGILLLFQGIATTIGPPIGGWITDVAGNSDATFQIAGALVVISAVILFLAPYLLRRRNAKAKNNVEPDHDWDE